jgi:outer membrane beta-barrel protein
MTSAYAMAQEPAADSLAATPPAAVSATAPTADPDSLDAPAPQGAGLSPQLTTVRKVRLDKEDRNVVRAGPGDGFAIVSVQPKGASFPVIAKNGVWYDVKLSDSESGWIHASLCHEFDDLSDLEWKPNPKRFTRTGSFIGTAYAGAYAFDRKSNSLVLGGRLGYYMFDRVQVEGGVSWTRVNRPAEIVENLFGLTLEAEKFDMLSYQLNLTWELMPGRQMVPFVTVGAGSSLFQGDTEPSFNFGAGTSLFLSRRLAMRWEVRDYHFSSGSDAARVTNDNIEFALGTMYLF